MSGKDERLKSELLYIVYALAGLFLVALLVFLGISISKANARKELAIKMEESYQNTYDNIVLKVNEDLLEVEYGDTFNKDKLVVESNGEVEIEGEVDTNVAGTYPLKFIVKTNDSYEQIITKEFVSEIKVVDTKKPIIELEEDKVLMLYGEVIKPNSNIVRVYDEVDGDISYSEELVDNSYTLRGDFDTSIGGIHEITVVARDKNGNESEKIYQIDVIGLAENAEYPFYIRINRALNNVTIYALDTNGDYSIPFKAMVCSTGAATPVGVYQTDVNYRWRALFGGVYGQYATRIVGDILFHSVPYYTQNPGDLEYEEYNKLGTAASMGCIRLSVADAKWIYDNCPIGTTVELYDDNNDVGPLGKPNPITIDLESPNKGWDPTDPDPNNPWLNN